MKVLIADNNALIRELLRQALAPLQWQMEVLADGADALAFLNSFEDPGMAVVGVDLPGISGLEICKRFVGRHPHHAVFTVLVTTKTDGALLEEALNVGVADVVVLPAAPEVIRARVLAASRTMLKMASLASQSKEVEAVPLEPTDPTIRSSGSTLNPKFQRFSALSKAPSLIVDAVSGMGFEKVQPAKQHFLDPAIPSHASWCCIVAPNCSMWVDFLVEADRLAGMKLFERLTGVPADSPNDASDTLGEIVNLIQGGIKAAMLAEGHETMTPVVPKRVPLTSLNRLNAHMQDRVRLVVDASGAVFCVTMFVHSAPIIRKTIEKLRARDVTIEALPMPGDGALKMLNRGVMLDDRWITNLRNRFISSGQTMSLNVVEPTPLINLLAGVSGSIFDAEEAKDGKKEEKTEGKAEEKKSEKR